jgi:hypothetical protein
VHDHRGAEADGRSSRPSARHGRRELAAQGHELHDGFHATEDRQVVRDQVFALLARSSVRADATYYQKANVYDKIKKDPDYFYKWVWFYHLKHVLPRVVPKGDNPFIGIATLGVKKKRKLYAEAVRDVVTQCLPAGARGCCAYWSAASHPALQAADYYTWGVGRWKEGGDPRSYELVRHQIRTLYQFV